MRGHQLCQIASHYLADRFDCVTMAMPQYRKRYVSGSLTAARQIAWMAGCPRDAIYFVTKQCVKTLHPVAADILKRRARGVLFDYVDADMATVSMRGADIHVCASHAQYADMTERRRHDPSTSVALLLHGYDCRLQRCAPKSGAVSAAYWGALRNTHIPATIAGDISVIDGSAAPDGHILQQLSRYRLHYGVRARSSDDGSRIFKPFTKGANAAACGANILVNRDAHDAIDLLGADYPYLVDAEDDRHIIEVFHHARDGVDGADWIRARNAMDDVADRLSPQSIARQLGRIVQPLTE